MSSFSNMIMFLKKFLQSVNIIYQCRSSRLPLWQCPSFLFVLMGLINIGAMISAYFIASRFSDEPFIVSLIVIVVTLILFIIGSLIVENFNKIVEANRLKSEFVSIVSHQLRSPLSSIRWTLNLILDKRLGDINQKVEEYLDLAKSSTKRMIELVNDILNVRHIEEGRFGVIKTLNLKDVAGKVFNDLRSFAQASNVDLRLETPGNVPAIKADPEELKLIIQNLVENGIKYIKNKGFVIIKMEVLNNFIRLSVKDNGVGIPLADQKYIFQRFFRASNARIVQTEGTGLGLFIAKSIVENLKGEIGFRSKEGKGSVFWFTLPIAKQ